MPSTTATPAQLVITGAEAATIPARFSATGARLRIVGGSATVGPGDGTDLDVTTPTLERLRRQTQYFDRDGTPTAQMQLHWQRTMEAIEAAFTALTTQVGDNTTLIGQIQQALNLAQAANDNATQALTRLNITDSFPSPADVLSASNSGTVSISAHDRIYGDGSSVNVNAGSITGLTPGQAYTIYYQDAARAGGAVVFQAATSNVVQSGDTHVIGLVTVPNAGETDAAGDVVGGPGTIDPRTLAGYDFFYQY